VPRVDDATKKMLEAAQIRRLTANGQKLRQSEQSKRERMHWRSISGRIPISQRG